MQIRSTSRRPPQWEDLKTLVAVHRGGSHSAAARELGLTHATIGRRLRDLEDAIGSALFERDEQGLRLSEAGQLVLENAQRMELAAQQLERQLHTRDAPSLGKVRLTCTEGIGTHLLPAHLPHLLAKYPGLEIELLVEARRLSLSRRHADMALRLARPEEPELVARHLADIGYRLYCAPAQAKHYTRLLREGAPLPLCRVDASLAELPEARWLEAHLPQAQTVLRSNSVLALTEACAAGLGAALLSCFSGQRLGLHVLESPAPPRRPIWLAYPAEYRNVARYRAVADWLGELFANQGPCLAGQEPATPRAPARRPTRR